MNDKRVTTNLLDISFVIPVVERHDNLQHLVETHAEILNRTGKSFELIFVIDGDFTDAFEILKKMKRQYPQIKLIKFTRNFWEAVALMVGFQNASGRYIFTLSSYFQVEPTVIVEMLECLERQNYDVVITRRDPRQDSVFNRLQAFLFHALVRGLMKTPFHDITCGLRGMKREVALDLELAGDMHRFIPILLHQRGYKIIELPSPQRPEDKRIRLRGVGVYSRRVIDILSLFFLVKFTRKPLRFFGLIGLQFGAAGALITAYLGFMRLFADTGLAGRPLLLLGLLLIVLGIQVASLGLIGELIIFTHGRNIKEYHVETILE